MNPRFLRFCSSRLPCFSLPSSPTSKHCISASLIIPSSLHCKVLVDPSRQYFYCPIPARLVRLVLHVHILVFLVFFAPLLLGASAEYLYSQYTNGVGPQALPPTRPDILAVSLSFGQPRNKCLPSTSPPCAYDALARPVPVHSTQLRQRRR